MDHDYLVRLRNHPTWRLLNADTAPLILSFFDTVFIKPNARSYTQSALTPLLDDFLFGLRRTHGDKYPKSAHEYLEDWSRGENAYLRKYYPEKGDEPEYDLTPASEKAIEWLRSLEPRAFVGTESRLLTILQLLRDVVQASETDPAARMAALEKQKAELDAQLERLKAGEVSSYDSTRVKERYYQITDTARQLLADFRQAEENFRELDRRAREKIATRSESKGRLLDEIFGEEDAIANSDQGKSFQAFWEFLMSPDRQQELLELAQRLLSREEVHVLEPDDLLPRLKYRLMESGEKVSRTLAGLVEHLRRFLDERAWLENKRIVEMIRSIEKRAVEIRQDPPRTSPFMEINDVRPEIDLTMARGLFIPSKEMPLQVEVIEGTADFDSDVLYNVHFVDEEELRGRLREALRDASQITLEQLCVRFPLEKGLSELLAYLNIAGKDDKAVIEEDFRETISWRDAAGGMKKAVVPRVIFTR